MGETFIDDCDSKGCPEDPASLGSDCLNRRCHVCMQRVYECSAEPGKPDWRRIHPGSDESVLENFSVGDIVRIAGSEWWVNLRVEEIAADDHAALLTWRAFGMHVPFWMSLHALEPDGSTPWR